jgi:hypothetical protein
LHSFLIKAQPSRLSIRTIAKSVWIFRVIAVHFVAMLSICARVPLVPGIGASDFFFDSLWKIERDTDENFEVADGLA